MGVGISTGVGVLSLTGVGSRGGVRVGVGVGGGGVGGVGGGGGVGVGVGGGGGVGVGGGVGSGNTPCSMLSLRLLTSFLSEQNTSNSDTRFSATSIAFSRSMSCFLSTSVRVRIDVNCPLRAFSFRISRLRLEVRRAVPVLNCEVLTRDARDSLERPARFLEMM